jgi:FolB domain-containing protein
MLARMTSPCADWIHLTEVAFPCIVGLHAGERTTSQTLSVEVSLNVDLDGAAAGDLARSVNYATTLTQIEFVAREGRWVLLESLGAALARLLLAPPACGEPRVSVAHVVVRLRKPDVLAGRGLPSVELSRPGSWLSLTTRSGGAGVRVEVLQEAREAGAYRVHLEPGAIWRVPAEMACLLIAGEVRSGTHALAAGDVVRSGTRLEAPGGACWLAVRASSGAVPGGPQPRSAGSRLADDSPWSEAGWFSEGMGGGAPGSAGARPQRPIAVA